MHSLSGVLPLSYVAARVTDAGDTLRQRPFVHEPEFVRQEERPFSKP